MDDYNKAVLNGIVKIASKMGISTIQSYQSSQIFEAVGISKEVIDKYFTGTVSRVGGISMADIQADVEALHNAAFDPLGLDINMELADGGAHKFRSGKEEHLFNPQTIHLFQKLPHRRLPTPSSSLPRRWTTWVPRVCICAVCWISTTPQTAASRWRR